MGGEARSDARQTALLRFARRNGDLKFAAAR
jgi:hypothetical protein